MRRHATAVDQASAVEPLLAVIPASASLILVGEASHGTHEFYRIRADLTRALIRERGFDLVAAEADWPDAYRVNRWVRWAGSDASAEAALGDFARFPRWMWRNRDVLAFLRWLKHENDTRPAASRVGFYGLDLYSLHRSMTQVIAYLDTVDVEAARRARQGYACFEPFGDDAQSYGYAASLRLTRSCEDDVVQQLVELQRRGTTFASDDGGDEEDRFAAEQNALVVRDAETYYRAMFRGGPESWNVRDRHMMRSLDRLLEHARRAERPARAVVWAHNSHLGDARATALADIGELNLGQLVRERFAGEAVTIGMTTHDGTVTAAHQWDEPADQQAIRPSLPESYERVFHDTGLAAFVLDLRDAAVAQALAAPRLERAIGVIYRPATERASHYFRAQLPRQFDVVVHVDRTSPVVPLDHHDAPAPAPDLPDTFPSGV